MEEDKSPERAKRGNSVQILEAYWSEHPAWFGRSYGEYLHLGANQEMLRISLVGLEITPKSKVLDICCALGGNGRWLASLFGATVEGIDPFAPAIQTAKKLARAQGLEGLCHFTVSQPKPLPFPHKSFDLVLTAEDEVEWDEISRVLVPNGRALGSSVAMSGLQALEAALTEAGLEIEKLVDVTAYARAFYKAKEEEARLLVDAGLVSHGELEALQMHTVDVYDAGASHVIFRARRRA